MKLNEIVAQVENLKKLIVNPRRQRQGVFDGSTHSSSSYAKACLRAGGDVIIEPWWSPVSPDFKFSKATIENGELVSIEGHEQHMPDLQKFEDALSSESVIQKGWKIFLGDLVDHAKEGGFHLYDTHNRFFLLPLPNTKGRAPDLSVFSQAVIGNLFDGYSLQMCIDWKRCAGNSFSLDDQGKLFKYAQIVLEQYQPFRRFFAAALCDGVRVQFFRFSRLARSIGVRAQKTKVFAIASEDGSRMFAGFILSRSHRYGASIPECAHLRISAGLTSAVYTDKAHKNGVVKVATHTLSQVGFQNEMRVLRHLAGRGLDESWRAAVLRVSEDSCEDFIRLQPKFQPLDSNVPYDLLLTLLDFLQMLHENQVVHLDIRVPNIMVTSEQHPRAVLVDFGASRLTTDAPQQFHHGSIKTASDRVLTAIASKEVFAALPSDDVQSFIRLCFMLWSKWDNVDLEEPNEAKLFWNEQEKVNPLLKQLLQLCDETPLPYKKIQAEMFAIFRPRPSEHQNKKPRIQPLNNS